MGYDNYSPCIEGAIYDNGYCDGNRERFVGKYDTWVDHYSKLFLSVADSSGVATKCLENAPSKYREFKNENLARNDLKNHIIESEKCLIDFFPLKFRKHEYNSHSY